jgi:plastocyanin
MKAVLVALLLSSVLLAGCSGSGGARVPEQDGEGRYVIHMSAGNKFVPANAQVPAGATVVWVHDGGAPHDVQAEDRSFSSGPAGGLTSGEEWAHTFNQTGTFTYYCHVHHGSGMSATLTVG